MKTYKVVIKVHEDDPVTSIIKTTNWKSALATHPIFYRCAIMELSCMWLKDYKQIKKHYEEFDIYVDVMELV